MSNVVRSQPAEIAETICAEYVPTHPRRPQISEAIRRALVEVGEDEPLMGTGWLILVVFLIVTSSFLTGVTVGHRQASPKTMVVSR